MAIRHHVRSTPLVALLTLAALAAWQVAIPAQSRPSQAPAAQATPSTTPPSPFARVGAAAVATSQAHSAAAAATIRALETANAGLQTQVAQPSGRLRITEPVVEVHVRVPVAALLAGDAAAVTKTRDELHDKVGRYDGCSAGVVLAFGHGPTLDQGRIQDGIDLAEAVVRELRTVFPALVRDAVIETAADLGPPGDQVDLRLYFFAGCPLDGTPIAGTQVGDR